MSICLLICLSGKFALSSLSISKVIANGFLSSTLEALHCSTLHKCKFYLCSHFLHVTVWEILKLLQCLLSCNSKTLQLSQHLLLDSLKLNMHHNVCFYFICLCTIYCAFDLWFLIWFCVKFYSASANYNLVAVQVI